MIRRLVLLGWVLCACTGGAWADGLADLERFLQQVQQGRVAFTQVVTPPTRAGEPARRGKTSSGTFEFSRPDRFRFQYARPFEQTIVADGQSLWLYDVDLNQVTVRAQAQALGQTPMALLTAAPDLQALRQAFELRSEEGADGIRWALAIPRQRDGQLRQVRIGFQGGQLVALDILDGFGQRSLISFGPLDVRPGFAAGHFRFTPPAGAEVLRQ